MQDFFCSTSNTTETKHGQDAWTVGEPGAALGRRRAAASSVRAEYMIFYTFNSVWFLLVVSTGIQFFFPVGTIGIKDRGHLFETGGAS